MDVGFIIMKVSVLVEERYWIKGCAAGMMFFVWMPSAQMTALFGDTSNVGAKRIVGF